MPELLHAKSLVVLQTHMCPVKHRPGEGGHCLFVDSHAHDYGDGQPSGACVVCLRDTTQLLDFLRARFALVSFNSFTFEGLAYSNGMSLPTALGPPPPRQTTLHLPCF